MKKLIFLLGILFFVVIQQANGQFDDKAIAEFEVTVPADYSHGTQIEDSKKKAQKDKVILFGYDSFFTNKNFEGETTKLLPGETFIIKIFPITEQATSQQCLAFLKNQKSLYFGLHGLTVVFDLKKDKLPKDKWIISFSPKDELLVDASGSHVVPYLSTSVDGDYGFEKCYFENDFWAAQGRTLLCITKKE